MKHRMHFDRSGMRPWIDEFKWEVMAWHYNFWMGPEAKKTLLKFQQGSEKLQFILDTIASRSKSKRFPTPTRRFFFRNALPMTIPFVRTSNPFCPMTENKVGWVAWHPKKIPCPRSQAKHQIGGTVPEPPVFPKNV